ncbi:uncharacterized protein AC631_05502 [Debaryomyces fabryi]|uniref:Transporter n=1 Tax=Debaryomyces fabryi TaxID=58627 RepID=A0A0V1PR78_9ASCO|nr:uncharacterized protein AC631_05502 [Debaryomyces fabryi]KRZ98741.1 hypothetical protein AC631_05502 [Debaryomyces fabryi]CUM51391.1 unnamed protein product [Debaryomyces fabryi]
MGTDILSKLIKITTGENEGGTGGESPQNGLSYQSISYLTFEAILEVVIICFAGFVAAKSGILNIQAQKVISQLNVDLFTPCLVFTKLAPSLSFEKMVDILIIPIFYAVSTGISYGCSQVVGWLLSLNDPETDFITAMAVFGNSNSLPVSLTLSLATTLPNLLWDDIEDDTPDKVASRGILYLLIFQQLGQVLRWSWGYNKLLRKRSPEEMNTYSKPPYNDDQEGSIYDGDEQRPLLTSGDIHGAHFSTIDGVGEDFTSTTAVKNDSQSLVSKTPRTDSSSSILTHGSQSYSVDNALTEQIDDESDTDQASTDLHKKSARIYQLWYTLKRLPVIKKFLAFMNPPLYAMLISVVVACVPALQREFFVDEDSFIHNTLSQSIHLLGSVSIPLILIVLGSNLYPSKDMPPPSRHYKRIVIGSLLSRMILPPFILLPIITLCVKFFKISILDDPIFLIVAFILTISPPAIQLSQITQLNNIYQNEMSGVLFWGYVILTLPTTIFIVVTSLEVLKWATS